MTAHSSCNEPCNVGSNIIHKVRCGEGARGVIHKRKEQVETQTNKAKTNKQTKLRNLTDELKSMP